MPNTITNSIRSASAIPPPLGTMQFLASPANAFERLKEDNRFENLEILNQQAHRRLHPPPRRQPNAKPKAAPAPPGPRRPYQHRGRRTHHPCLLGCETQGSNGIWWRHEGIATAGTVPLRMWARRLVPEWSAVMSFLPIVVIIRAFRSTTDLGAVRQHWAEVWSVLVWRFLASLRFHLLSPFSFGMENRIVLQDLSTDTTEHFGWT